MNDKTKLNLLAAPWTVRFSTYQMHGSFHVTDNEGCPVATAYTEADAKVLSLTPELVDYLTEAMYEYCFNCREYDDLPLCDTAELIAQGCHKPNGACFVQRWMNTLKKIQDALKEGTKYETR